MRNVLLLIILSLCNTTALACYDGAGSGRCGWYGTSPYGAGIGYGGSYNNTLSYPQSQNRTIHLDNRYGAIAMSNNSIMTSSVSALSKRAAKEEALSRCKQDGGIGCKIIFSISNGCFSVAQGERHHTNGLAKVFADSSANKGEAENLALQQCYKHGGFEKCSVLVPEQCSLPTLSN